MNPLPAVIVDKGDTLSGIAERELGRASSWKALAIMNKISDPKLIQPGDIIVLPRRDGLAEARPRARPMGDPFWTQQGLE